MADNRLQLGIVISADGKAAEQALDRVKGKLGQVSRSTTDMAAAANLARSAFSAMAATLSARELIRTADAYAGMQARLKLVSGSTREFLTAQTELYRISQQNLAPLGETITLYTKLSTSIRDMGKSQADALQVTDLVAKTLRISGASAQESAAALLQFGQALGSGVLQGDELRSILESSPRLARALAEGLGVATGQLKAMGAAGELSSRKVVEALQSQASTIKAEYTNLPLTVSGAWQQMENAATKYIGQTDQAAGSSRKLAEALSLVANNLEAIADPLATVVGAITKIEVGGWLQFRDILDGIKTNLKEMVGLKDAGTVDPEVQRLIAMGQGQVPIADLAAATESQAQYFDGVKRGANDALLAVTKLSEAQKAVASMVIDTARANKVDPAWALAIAQQESGFNQLAKSAAGAQGVMQLMPGTAKQLGVNINDVNENIKGGVLYLKQQQEHFKSLKLATAAYNAGPGNVIKYGGVPPFKETQDYVPLVGELYQKWQQVLGIQGEAFNSARDQAEELKTAYESLKTHQDGMVSAAENFAKVQVEKIKTSLTALEAERKATQDVASAQLASVKTYDEKQAILAKIASQQDDFNRRAADLAREEIDAQQQVIETRKRALETELANADRYNLTIIEQAKIKQAIADADADMAVLAQQRAQAEIAAGQAVSEASKQALALKQKEQESIAGVVAEYERQVEILNRLTQAKQSGAGADLLGRLNQVYQQSGGLPEIVSTGQIQRLQEVLLKTMAVKDAIQEMTKATLAQGKAEQAVREEQLRQNAFWDQFIGRIQDYANTWQQISGNTNDAFAKMTVAAFNYTKQVEQIGQLYRDLNGKPTKLADSLGDMAPAMEGIQQLEASLNLVAKSLLTIRDQYEQGSAQYQKYQHAAAGVAVAAQAAAVAEGILAVVHQMSSGEPYTAIPRALAVAAMLASMGIQSGASGGSASAAQNQQAKTGTGSVLGDSSAQSLSISRSIDLIAQNTSNDLNYSAAMLRALQNIESALLGASSLILRSVLPSIKADIGNSGLDFGMKKISLFSGFDKQVTDAGIGQVAAQSLRSILKSGFKTLAKYADITDSFKVLGMELSSSTKTYIRSLDADVTGQFNRVIKGMADALMEGGKAFGLTADDFNTRLAKFKVDIGKLSLKDLSSEEAQKQIEAAFSKVFDGMADALSVGLGKFKRGGEGAAETFFRVAEGIQRATGELAQLGMKAIDYREIVNKQGDVAAEIVRQTLVAQGRLEDGTREYVDALTGSAEDIIDAYKKLVEAQDLMKTAIGNSDGADKLNRTLINAAGGLDKFVSSMQSFNENFLSDAERFAGDISNLAEKFAALGLTMPATKEAFKELVLSLAQGDEASQKLAGALLNLQDKFAKAADRIKSIQDKYADILNPMGKYGAQIDAVINDFNELIANAVAPIQAGLKELTDPWKATLKQDQADLTKFQDLRVKALQNIDAWQKELDELSAKPNKNKKRIAELRDWIADAKRRVDSYDLAISAITDEIASLQQAIADAIAKGAIDEAKAKSELLSQAGTVMFKTMEDIWDQLTAGVQKGKDYLAALQDQILQLQGDIGGPSVILDNAKYKEQLAKGALNSYTGGDATVEIDLIKRVQDAVMARYQAELDIINQRAQALKDEQAALQQEQSRLDGLVSQLTSQLDSIQGVITSIADAIAELDASLSGNAVDYAIKKYDYAQQAITQYLNALANGTPRDTDRELKLIQDMQNAVMARYQAELADIQRITDAQVKALTDERDARQKAHDEQIDALQKEMDAARKLSDAVKSIAEYAQRLKLGAFSDLSPERKLAEANRQYQDLLTKANSGDADAIASMANASDAYLQAAKDYYGSGSQYSTILSGVQQAMESLGAMDVADPDSIQARIDELNAAHAEYLKSIDARIADLNDPEKNAAIKALRERTITDLQALQGYADKTAKLIDQRLVEAREQAAANQAKLDEVNAKLAALNTDEEIKALKERTVIELQALQQKLIDATALAAEQAKEQFQSLIQKAIDANVLSQQQIDLLRAMATQMGATPAYASGGYAPAGMALVGERGPELVRFERPAQVMTAEQTRRILTPKDDAQIAQAIGELKAEMRAVVVTQSGANPQIIAELREMRGRLEAIERTNRVKS